LNSASIALGPGKATLVYHLQPPRKGEMQAKDPRSTHRTYWFRRSP
jgi:hypothetical protein